MPYYGNGVRWSEERLEEEYINETIIEPAHMHYGGEN